MTRRKLFASLFVAPFAATAALRPQPVDADRERIAAAIKQIGYPGIVVTYPETWDDVKREALNADLRKTWRKWMTVPGDVTTPQWRVVQCEYRGGRMDVVFSADMKTTTFHPRS